MNMFCTPKKCGKKLHRFVLNEHLNGSRLGDRHTLHRKLFVFPNSFGFLKLCTNGRRGARRRCFCFLITFFSRFKKVWSTVSTHFKNPLTFSWSLANAGHQLKGQQSQLWLVVVAKVSDITVVVSEILNRKCATMSHYDAVLEASENGWNRLQERRLWVVACTDRQSPSIWASRFGRWEGSGASVSDRISVFRARPERHWSPRRKMSSPQRRRLKESEETWTTPTFMMRTQAPPSHLFILTQPPQVFDQLDGASVSQVFHLKDLFHFFHPKHPSLQKVGWLLDMGAVDSHLTFI